MKSQIILLVFALALALAGGAGAAPAVEATSSLTVTYDLRTNAVRKVTDSADILAIARDWAGDGNAVTVAPAAGTDKKDPATWAAGAATTLEGTAWTPTEQRCYKLVLTAGTDAYEAYFDLTELAGATAKASLAGYVAGLATARYEATGEAVTPTVTVTKDETALAEGTDFEVAYADNVNVGTACAYVLGKGDYDGLLSTNFFITPMTAVQQGTSSKDKVFLDLRTNTVLKITQLTNLFATAWNSSADWPAGGDSKSAVQLRAILTSGDDREDPTTWVDGGIEVLETLTKEGTTNWVPAQASLVRIELTQGSTVVNGYLDLKDCKDLEAAKDISEFTATLSFDTAVCDGYFKCPTVTLTDTDGNVLTEGMDYSVTYSQNLNVGIATVTIAGLGDYQGVVYKAFTITKAVPAEQSSASLAGTVTVDERVPDGGVMTLPSFRELPVLVWNDTEFWRRGGSPSTPTTTATNGVRVFAARLSEPCTNLAQACAHATGFVKPVLVADGEGVTNVWPNLKRGDWLLVGQLATYAYDSKKKTGVWTDTPTTNAVRILRFTKQPGALIRIR